MSKDEAARKAFEALIYQRGQHLATASAMIGTIEGWTGEVTRLGDFQETRPDGPHIAIATLTIGLDCSCCPDTPITRLRLAIKAISTGKLPRCHFSSLVLPVDGGVEIVTYGLAELWALRVSMDADGEATGWAEIHVEDSQILVALDAYLGENPQFEKGWHFATQAKFQNQLPLQYG
jgi:hypothetical protein